MKNNKSDFYYFGKCKFCGKAKALKNGVCSECKNRSSDGLDYLKNMLGLFDKEK